MPDLELNTKSKGDDFETLNLRMTEFHEERMSRTLKLLEEAHIRTMAWNRQTDLAERMRMPVSAEVGVERIRCMLSFEQEVLSLAPAHFPTLFEQRKSALPLYAGQKLKAKQRRAKIGDGRETVYAVILGLMQNPEYCQFTAGQFWSPFVGKLRDIGCNPEEIVDLANPRSIKVTYDFERSASALKRANKREADEDSHRRSLTIGGLANIISKVRRDRRRSS